MQVKKEHKERKAKKAMLEKKAIREIRAILEKKVIKEMLLPMLILRLPKFQNCKNQLLIKW